MQRKINTVRQDRPRYEGLKQRAAAMGVGVSDLARRLNYNRSYLSTVLNGAATSNPVMDLIESELDKIEKEKAIPA